MNYTQQAPRRKNYTPLPNEVFSLGLSSGELAVYAYLLYCEDRRTYQSWPSYKTIGRAIHRSKGAVKRYVDGLVVKGLITAEPTSVIMQNSLKKNGNLCYHIRPISEAVKLHYQHQLSLAEVAAERQRAQEKLAAQNVDAPCSPL